MGRRHHRRVWVSEGRAHVEVRGLDQPGGDRLAVAVRARLERLDGVSWVCVPGPLDRAVVAAENGVLDLQALLAELAEVEQAHGVQRQPFPADYPEHPGDLQPLQRELAALAADLVAISFTAVGRLAQFTPVPIKLLSFGSMIDSVPRLRSLLARLLGWPMAEVTLSTANAVSAGLTQGAFGLVVDVAHRWGQLAEHRARRQVWAQREAELCVIPTQPPPQREPVVDRPVPLPPGPIERTGDRLMIASFGAAGAMLAATSNPQWASRLLLAGVPRAARLGREAFAAQLGRTLAARGVLVLDPAVLRRLDRIDTMILDADVIVTGGSRLDGFVVLADVDAPKLERHAHALFDPNDPHRPQAHGPWRLCPASQLDAALPHGAQRRMRDCPRKRTKSSGSPVTGRWSVWSRSSPRSTPRQSCSPRKRVVPGTGSWSRAAAVRRQECPSSTEAWLAARVSRARCAACNVKARSSPSSPLATAQRYARRTAASVSPGNRNSPHGTPTCCVSISSRTHPS